MGWGELPTALLTDVVMSAATKVDVPTGERRVCGRRVSGQKSRGAGRGGAAVEDCHSFHVALARA